MGRPMGGPTIASERRKLQGGNLEKGADGREMLILLQSSVVREDIKNSEVGHED